MDVTNWHLVSVMVDESIVVQRPPMRPMPKADALLFAAWLVTLAEETAGQFEEILQKVRDT